MDRDMTILNKNHKRVNNNHLLLIEKNNKYKGKLLSKKEIRMKEMF